MPLGTGEPSNIASNGRAARGDLAIALLAPDGVGIRNFVINSYLKRYVGRMLVLHSCPDDVPEEISRSVRGIEWRKLMPLRDTAMSYTLRQALSYAHLFWADTSSMRFTRNRPVGGSWKTRAAAHTAKLMGRLTASQTGIGALEKAYFRTAGNSPAIDYYRRVFQENRPSIVLSCNHRSPSVLGPVLAAKSLGIPVVTFVASWDNLTSKGRIAAPFDHYLLWSENMRRELLEFYPSIRPEQAHIVGTPQFDCYGDESIKMSREEFFCELDADPTRPLICFSGGDIGNCPQDPEHLTILLDFIRAGVIRGNPQVVVRPAPVDPGTRYQPVCAKYPEVIYRQPDWKHLEPGEWSRCMPMPEDVRFLANLTRHADVNVNNGSTMTLDFGLRDKPVVNLCFDVGEILPGRLPLWDYHNWEHYRPVIKLGAARFARSAEQLAEHVNAYLDNPAADRQGRRGLVDLQVSTPIGDSGRRIAETLETLAVCSRR